MIVPLSHAKTNAIYKIAQLSGDLKTRLRLINLGFHNQSELKILSQRLPNIIISVDGCRFAIDAHLSKMIQVTLNYDQT